MWELTTKLKSRLHFHLDSLEFANKTLPWQLTPLIYKYGNCNMSPCTRRCLGNHTNNNKTENEKTSHVTDVFQLNVSNKEFDDYLNQLRFLLQNLKNDVKPTFSCTFWNTSFKMRTSFLCLCLVIIYLTKTSWCKTPFITKFCILLPFD